MSTISRRQFNTMIGAGALAFGTPIGIRAQAKPKVVVIGGGSAGATTARYIAKDAGGAVDVTLISASDEYTTCFFSNLYLGGFRSLESITHGYDKLASGYGINMKIGYAAGVDTGARQVRMADGSSVAYDRLVVTPGIDLIYDSVPGYSEEAAQMAPHAWQAGAQTQLLKQQLDGLQNGQDIVMVPPPNPYRCPPGPYERVSMMAHILKQRGMTDSKVIVLDPKPKFSKQALFQEGWEKHYPGVVEWYGPDVHGGVKAVDAQARTVETDLDTFEAGVLNVIPAQKAGQIAFEAGLTNDSGFCPIVADSMQSTNDENIYVLGDASIAGAMPKSGFSANSQAKVAAMSIRGELTGSRVFPAKFSNTCWSLIGTDDGVKVGAQYAVEEGKIAATSKFISKTGESDDVRKTTYEESLGWYFGITNDIFG